MNDDLNEELRSTMDLADEIAFSLKPQGRKKVQAGKDYKIVLRQETLKAKAEGMAIGLIDKTVAGKENVVEAWVISQIAESDIDSDIELLQWLKLKARLLDNQISREWRNPEGL